MVRRESPSTNVEAVKDLVGDNPGPLVGRWKCGERRIGGHPDVVQRIGIKFTLSLTKG